MSTLVLTVKMEEAVAVLQQRYQRNNNNTREQALDHAQLFEKLGAGLLSGSVDVQTASADPVKASGTWTLASVVDTDAVSCGTETLTFATSPSGENQIEVDVGSAKAFASATDIDIETGYITESSHGYLTGDVGQFTTDDTLPTGISASTDYFVIRIDANTYAVASSLANADAGTILRPSDTGTGNQTFTPDADKSLAVRLRDAVNAHSVLSEIVVATASGAVTTVTSLVPGPIGNQIVFSDADATITSSGSGYLAGGTGGPLEEATTYALGL